MALKRLGIEDCFDQIICFETMNPNLSKSTSPDEFPVLLKPSVDAMKVALRVADVDPRRTVSNPLSRVFLLDQFSPSTSFCLVLKKILKRVSAVLCCSCFWMTTCAMWQQGKLWGSALLW
jgi:hypothetical protein